jgi:hypothetical protein
MMRPRGALGGGFGRWSAAPNAHLKVSDAALAALESAAAAESSATSRLSCSSASREHLFLGRAEDIRSFLMDQAKALGGAGRAGTGGCHDRGRRRRQRARLGHGGTTDADASRHGLRHGMPTSVAPPEYHWPNAQHVADNKTGRVRETQDLLCHLRLPQHPGPVLHLPSRVSAAWSAGHASAAGGQGPAHPWLPVDPQGPFEDL